MGIPSFYRWLVERYPLTVMPAIEEAPKSVNGVTILPDSTQPNPNGFEFDNLYLDMNGIIHPCFHPEGVSAPKTYDEVFKAVFSYIDKIFAIVRPRKLLYMAIDGVAPRAKMNQQRQRRFRAAQEAAEEGDGTENQRGTSKTNCEELRTTRLDSNIITPGTEFMALLATALRYYVHLRMNKDPGWQGIKVIVSDASVPGEGEHKIMSYIRLQRNLPGFDPNTRHCLYGLDADLIMLALATHEIHFSILREEVVQKNVKKQTNTYRNLDNFILRQKFQFLHIWVLRNYLTHELRIPDSTVETDLERLIDDFVFMCLFVGNDFLPHVPSLEISEGAIDLLMIIYKKEFVQMGGYLTNSSEVNLRRVEHFLQVVGSHEDAIFKKRWKVHKQKENQFRRRSVNVQKKNFGSVKGQSTQSSIKEGTNSAVLISDAGNSATDKVKLGEVGWKERYYTEKFDVKTDDERLRTQRDTVLKYIEGICWVMHYYYQGVCSWQWFYPYHYAPFASDLCGLDQLEIRFALGEPFMPLDQLMAVLPAASAQALPLLYSKLMTDPSSPILDFYPTEFELDLNGKHFAWQAVCKLPFITESRLLSEIAKVEPLLTDEEKKRNSLGSDMLFVHISYPLAAKVLSFFSRNRDHPKLPYGKLKKKINPIFSGGMNGYICISDKPVNPIEIPSPIEDMDIITENKVISVIYNFPSFHPHIPKLPVGVQMPAECVKEHDLQPPPVMWHVPSLFGRDLTARPIPKLSISGSQLAESAHWLVTEYYLGKWKTLPDATENCVDHERTANNRKRLAKAIEDFVTRPGPTKRDSKNSEGGFRMRTSMSGQDLPKPGGENHMDDGARKTSMSGQDLPKPGGENHMDDGARKSKTRTKKRRKLVNEEVPLGQLAMEAVGENQIVGGTNISPRKRKMGQDQAVCQEVQNSLKPPTVGNENQIGGAKNRKNKRRKAKAALQDVQNSPKKVTVGNENNIRGGSKDSELVKEEASLEACLAPELVGASNENQIDSGAGADLEGCNGGQPPPPGFSDFFFFRNLIM